MEKITLPKASSYTSPNPVSIICTKRPDGLTNLATVSWWTYLSYNPNMVAFAMAKTSFSGEMVRDTKKAILTLPSSKLSDVVLQCGSTTGHNTDKVAKFNIAMENLPESEIQIPKNSCLAI